jgi:integrase
MATIEKRERQSGVTYKTIVRLKGFPVQRKTFKRLTDAKIWAQQTEAAIRRGEMQAFTRARRGKTVHDVIERYRNEVLPEKAAGTQVTENAYLTFWDNAIGSYALSYVTPEIIGERLAELGNGTVDRRKDQTQKRDEPARQRSRRTLKHYRDTLERLFKWAKRWDWLSGTPFEHVNPISRIKDERDRFLSDDERSALLKACRSSANEGLYPIVVFALSTGARKGEIVGLKLGDLDLARNAAVLRDTKNGETRVVPVVHHLHGLMAGQVKKANTLGDQLGLPKHDRWLFPREDGHAPIDIRKAWESARDTAGLVDFRFHDLRHSTASYLAMNGASLVEIADVLGHKTLQMVKRYAHLSESHVKNVVETLNKRIFPGM